MDLIEIYVADELSPAIKRMLEHNKVYLRHVTKSLAWHIQKEIKQNVKKGALLGSSEGWSKQWFTKGNIEPRKELQGGRASQYLYGQMLRAIGYQYVPDSMSAIIGWTSKTSAMCGRLNEEGGEQQVTSAIRKKYYEAYQREVKKYGAKAVMRHDDKKYIYPLRKDKTTLNVPARPIFSPMFQELQDDFAPYIEKKIDEYMKENVEFGKKNKRVYKVYRG